MRLDARETYSLLHPSIRRTQLAGVERMRNGDEYDDQRVFEIQDYYGLGQNQRRGVGCEIIFRVLVWD